MSKRHWGNEFAVGLVAGASLVVVVFVFWYGPACGPDYPCGYPRQNEPNNGSIWYDTMAQWVAAVTGLAVACFTFWTVLLVREALAADDAALHEAREQTKIARSVGEAQTRAFVGVCDEKMSGPSKEEITFEIRNFGQSIARDVTACISWSLTGKDFQSAKQDENRLQTPMGSMHPGQKVRCIIDPNDPVFGSGQAYDFLGPIRDTERVGYVFGYITYTDIFGVSHRTKIARIVSYSNGAFGLHYSEHGNEAD